MIKTVRLRADAASPEPAWSELVQETQVHRSLYVDPEVYRLELERVFGRAWLYVGHESELAEPGAFKTVSAGRRHLLLTRDRDGDLAAFFNRCTHRGTLLCRAESGKAASFTCPYHGWSFTEGGRLVGVPHPKGYPEDPRDGRFDLVRPAAFESYRGLLFARFSLDGAPLADWLGGAKPYLDRFVDRSTRGNLTVTHGAYRMLIHANWKTIWDNSTDGYHPGASHASILKMTRARYGGDKSLSHFRGSPDDTAMYQVALGGGHTFLDQAPAMGSKWQRARPAPGSDAAIDALRGRIPADELESTLEDVPGAGMNLNVFPNLMIIGNQLVVIEPLAPDRFSMVWHATTFDGLPPELNAVRLRIAEDFPNFGEVDDVDMWEHIQQGLQIPEVEWIDMSRGLHTDRLDPATGQVWGKVTSDTGMRGYYRQYHSMMSEAAPNC